LKLSRLSFVEIGKNGEPIEPVGPLSDAARDVCHKTARLYEPARSYPPWIGYLVLENDAIVGTCAFRSPPQNGKVEIAYFTFPGFEGRGFATEMGRHLIQIVKDTEPGTRIFAFTLPEKNASARILQRLGFGFAGETRDEDGLVVWQWELPTVLEFGEGLGGASSGESGTQSLSPDSGS
jgi:GNAT superfamily N-acetyltransferase